MRQPAPQIVVVDGHNVFNDAGRYFAESSPACAAASVGTYLRDWFDIDRLVTTTLPQLHLDPWSDLGIVLLHSRKSLGRGTAYAIMGEDALAFWTRQGSAPNTSAMLVELAGAPSGKDVGMDVSIVVYLFETSDRWDAAYLFSDDSDFAPAIWSLRRRGKRVYCSSPTTNMGSPLVQACQSFLPWNASFLRVDKALFDVVAAGGTLDRFLDRMHAERHVRATVRVEPDRLVIDPGWPGGGMNVMNEMLRDARQDLYCAETRDTLDVFVADPGEQRPGILSGPLFEGLRRHRNAVQGAAWCQFAK